MYFPVRLDQKGRLYCNSSYLDYQANDLSKSLILFAEPGIIEKNNVDSIIFFLWKKTYGANYYGGNISKKSMDDIRAWVDRNIDNILNYDKGSFLNKAKDKLTFLAFCMEFKRFFDFYTDDGWRMTDDGWKCYSISYLFTYTVGCYM